MQHHAHFDDSCKLAFTSNERKVKTIKDKDHLLTPTVNYLRDIECEHEACDQNIRPPTKQIDYISHELRIVMMYEQSTNLDSITTLTSRKAN